MRKVIAPFILVSTLSTLVACSQNVAPQGKDGDGSDPTVGTRDEIAAEDRDGIVDHGNETNPLPSGGMPTSSSPPITSCPPPLYQPTFKRTFTKADGRGGDKFAAGYDFVLALEGKQAAGTEPYTLTADGSLAFKTTVFGKKLEPLRAQGRAYSKGSNNLVLVRLSVLGRTVITKQAQSNLVIEEALPEKKIFEVSKTFWAGPVPVKVKAGAYGSAKIVFNAGIIGASLRMNVGPSGKLTAKASAEVDIILASAGVEAALDLIEAGLPYYNELALTGTKLVWSTGAELTWKSLAGKVRIWGKLVGGKKHYVTLAQWDAPFKGTIPIVNVSSCKDELPTTKCGNKVCEGNETWVNCPADCPKPPGGDPGGGEDPDEDVCAKKPWMCGEKPEL